MNISCMINIDNSSVNEFKINQMQYKKNIFRNINCTKFSLIKNKNDIKELCNWLRIEISQ